MLCGIPYVDDGALANLASGNNVLKTSSPIDGKTDDVVGVLEEKLLHEFG